MEFKDRIKFLRESKEMSYTALAAKFDKTESAARAWELGRSKPDADTLIKLAQYFDCTTDYLLGLAKDKNPQEAHWKETIFTELHSQFDKVPDKHYEEAEWIIKTYLRIWDCDSVDSGVKEKSFELISDIVRHSLHLNHGLDAAAVSVGGVSPDYREMLANAAWAEHALFEKQFRMSTYDFMNFVVNEMGRILGVDIEQSNESLRRFFEDKMQGLPDEKNEHKDGNAHAKT